MARMLLIALAPLMLACIAACINASAAPIPTTPELSVAIDPPTQEAVVTDKTAGALIFAGSVSVDKLPVERVTVNLVASVDSGWPSSVSPSSMVITDTQAHSFSVSIIVPAATLAEKVGHVKVTGTATGTGYTVTDDARANITVAPYYMLMLNSSAPFEEVEPGQPAFFTIVVTNPGNANDSYELEIVNLKDLKEEGWSVELDKTLVPNIRPHGAAEVTITARPPQGWRWDIHMSMTTVVILEASSLGARSDGTMISMQFPVIVNQKGFNMPLVNLIEGIIALVVILSIVAAVLVRRKRKKRKSTIEGA